MSLLVGPPLWPLVCSLSAGSRAWRGRRPCRTAASRHDVPTDLRVQRDPRRVHPSRTRQHGHPRRPRPESTGRRRRWAASEAFRTVQRLARAAGIQGQASPHGLRHTHATLALDAGVPLRDLQDSMGRARARLERSSSYAVASMLA
ncbi:tyrosine-type recombinase/integrase [Microbacterium hominis]|uniref:tyrosine-type recombinase/integrase n=1 Tax=Microbacterium hominis TaxID=162426 RepID=UPI0037C9B9AA